MPAIHLDHLSFSHSSAVDLLHDVTVHLGDGWTALVGANGSGKTSLLRLVAGELEPAAGNVILDPSSAVVAYCEQELEHMSDEVATLGESWDGRDVTLRGRLHLDPAQLRRWSSLSPGERKRWQVGAALAAEPDVLLLDEPTNHLDTEGRTWLLDALQRFTGVGLVVSHDRVLLESLTTRTLRVSAGTVELWNGSYSVAHAAWIAAREHEVAGYRQLRKEQKKLDRRIADQRRAADTKRAAYKRRIREADFKDIDARSAVTEGHFREGEAAAAKKLSTTVRARDRIAGRIEDMTVTKELGGGLFVDYEPAEKSEVAVATGDLVVGDRVLVADLNAVVRRADRVWLRGRNGAGKTTLLEMLRSTSPLPASKILYLSQELTEAASGEQLAALLELDPEARGRVLSIVATLGVDPDVLLASARPSPGEARKLAMALGLGRSAWLLLLDEPTNHLDLPSIERLEAALAAYPGAMVVVTHDDAFGAALDLSEWWIDEGTLRT